MRQFRKVQDEEAQELHEAEIKIGRVAITKAEPESRDSESGDNENRFPCYFVLNLRKNLICVETLSQDTFPFLTMFRSGNNIKRED